MCIFTDFVRTTPCLFFQKIYFSSTKKGKMWRAYHQLRTAVTFRNDWKVFLHNSISQQAHPAFYQHVTSMVFKELMKTEYPLSPPDIAEHPDRPLTFEERNALRFVAGYVCRKVRTKLEATSLPEKEELNYEFCWRRRRRDRRDRSMVEQYRQGGSVARERHRVCIFRYCGRDNTTIRHIGELQSQDNMKQKMLEYLMHHGDVLFQWSFLTTSISDSVALLLLERILRLYVTVRGFGFATSCVEMFKQNTKQSFQRKKALRKHISS